MRKILLAALLALMALAPGYAPAAEKGALPKGYEKWERSRQQVVTDKKSLFYGIHYTFVNKQALQSFKTGGPYPEGGSFVVVQYSIREGGGKPAPDKKQMIVVMNKDRRFRETGGWQFAGFTAKGRPSGIDPVQNCYGCHLKSAKGSDLVISKYADFR